MLTSSHQRQLVLVCRRCLLERLALAIFRRHTSTLTFDPERSGVEWWAQVRRRKSTHEEIQLHWDMDERRCDRTGSAVCPTLSTVTYLDDCGMPTALIDEVSDEPLNEPPPCPHLTSSPVFSSFLSTQAPTTR